MIVYTAKDIIKQAKWISNTTNSTLTDFYINTNLLSQLYKELYMDVVDNDSQYITTVETNDTSYYIGDVYKVAWVGYKNNTEILRSSLRNRIAGTYYIENDTLYLPAGEKKIKFVSLPETITVPDDSVKVELSSYPSLLSNAGIDEDYNITTEDKIFHNTTIDFSNFPDWLDKTGTTIKNVNVSDPYMMVSYSDGTVRLYEDIGCYVDWNPIIEKGKSFNGYVLAFTSDDTTGKGVLYYDNKKQAYYYGSFVPNTVLSYPNNVFFEILIYRLGAILASMAGIENPYITNTLLPNAEIKFQQSLTKGSATRITNIYGGGYGLIR